MRITTTLGLIFSVFWLLTGCASGTADQENESSDPQEVLEASVPEEFPVFGNLVTITSNQMDFQVPGEIPSGLTTFRYVNNSSMTHLILFDKMPVVDGVQLTHENSVKEVVPPFQEGMDLLNEGKTEEAMEAFGKLPAWYPEVTFPGGVGLTGANTTTQVTMNMEPGTYTFECYVKTNGVFHTSEGMAVTVVVTDSGDAAGDLPEADVVVNVNEDGFAMDGTPTEGMQTFRVNYHSQKVHEHFLKTDVNIVKLDPEVNPNEVQVWVNWMVPTGLETPAPAHFAGGIQEMPEGGSGVFTVRLEAGEYALIAEVPESGSKGLFKTFTVSSASAASASGN